MLLTPGTVQEAALEALTAGWNLNKDQVHALTHRTLGTLASDVRGAIEGKLITGVFGIEAIIRQILKRNEEHARAIDAVVGVKDLEKSDVWILHVRLLEESFTTAAFLAGDKDRFDEFGWRWSAFPTIHAIRNRVFGLNQPLDEKMTTWIKSHEKQLGWFDPKGRLTADMSDNKTREQWEKTGNWLTPITIKDVFEKAGRLDSYKRKGYDMGSQSVHLSPMGDQYMSYELEHHDYAKFALESAAYFVIKMFSICADLVTDPAALRKDHARENLVQTYALISGNAARFSYLTEKQPAYAAFVQAVVGKPKDTAAIIESVVGKAPPSKFELKL